MTVATPQRSYRRPLTTPEMLVALSLSLSLFALRNSRLAGDALKSLTACVNSFDSVDVLESNAFVPSSLIGSCLSFKGTSVSSARSQHQDRYLKCNNESAPAAGRCWYYTQPSPPRSQCPSAYKKQTGNKRSKKQKKGKKNKSPHPPTGPASTPEISNV